MSTREACIQFVPKVKCKYEVYSAVKLSMFTLFDMNSAG